MEGLLHFIHGGGFVMYPLMALSLAALFVIAERALAFRQLGGNPPGLLEKVLNCCGRREYGEAQAVCAQTPGPLSACLGTVLAHSSRPVAEIERLVEETGQEFFIALERLLPVLDTTTTVSPLLGLLGTIVGMIGAFNAIALQQHRGNTDAVLGGVGEALYATATGLTLAVICFIAYNYFAARLRTVSAQTEQGTTRLINLLLEQGHLRVELHARAGREG